MRAALLDAPNALPRIVHVPSPAQRDGFASVAMHAVALTNLDRAVAEGRHYFSSDEWPHRIGREGVGEHDGQRVFVTAAAIPDPLGSLAERTLAFVPALLPVPEGIGNAPAAAIGNAGLAAWLALSWRGRLQPRESVLVLGATGASGGIAVTAARLLGGGRIVAAGRNAERLAQLAAAGADATVCLGDHFGARLRDANPEGFDVVVDFLNADPAEEAMRIMRSGGRLVQVGSSAGPSTRVDAQLSRRLSLDVLGFAYYHAPPEAQRDAYARLCDATVAGQVKVPFQTMPFDDVAEAWTGHGRTGRRYVLEV